ncbi:MAG: hypothetical protein MN733_31120 [Nitrososphaera sp.]|nr:hypothetical protein [Nitrososphaera sp.]
MITSIAKIFAGLTPEKHTVGAPARTKTGFSVSANNPRAVKWCATGWLDLKYPDHASYIQSILGLKSQYACLVCENDHRGYALIEDLLTLDEEIELPDWDE